MLLGKCNLVLSLWKWSFPDDDCGGEGADKEGDGGVRRGWGALGVDFPCPFSHEFLGEIMKNPSPPYN